jgi:hypothetical protein
LEKESLSQHKYLIFQIEKLLAFKLLASYLNYIVSNTKGWMHSGYPMMGFVSAVPDQVNVSLIQKEGNWGFVHETGHNHQWDSWTISATTETGCNMWSLYVHQNVRVLY